MTLYAVKPLWPPMCRSPGVGLKGFFRRYAGEYPKFSPGVWYRIDKGPWQLADTIDQVPTGAELYPCHRQRGEG